MDMNILKIIYIVIQHLHGFKIYNDLNTVCFGFSKLIVNKLLETYNK